MTAVRDWANAAWYRTLELQPNLYCRYQARFDDRNPVVASTTVVIEGYASAANTFAREAFLLANPGISIASHLHSVAPLQEAKRRNIPALVLLREPVASIVSLLARFDGHDLRTELRRYTRFYTKLASVRDHALIVPFEDVTQHVSLVMQRLNDRFGCSFTPFDEADTPQLDTLRFVIEGYNRQRFGADAELRGALPSSKRALVARPLRERLTSGAYAIELSRASRLYEEAMEWSHAR